MGMEAPELFPVWWNEFSSTPRMKKTEQETEVKGAIIDIKGPREAFTCNHYLL